MKETAYWHAEADGEARCELCPHGCRIGEGQAGICRVRGVRHGQLVELSYGRMSALNIDPIEKKPLYHFLPASSIFSVGGWGCNFRCVFCQNWSISQQMIEAGERHDPESLVADAESRRSRSIAYTYNEPLVNFEFVIGCCRVARRQGLRNVLVTNGYINPEPAAELLALVDAANIDIKSMDDAFYRTQCGGSVEPVLAFAAQAREAGCHIELTNLVIPGLNDSDSDFARLATWIESALGPATPLHLSAYHPQYRMNIHATPTVDLQRGHRICSQYLCYVYLGNVFTETGRNTHCPSCGALLVQRTGTHTRVTGLSGRNCAQCGRESEIVVDE
ncbi:MAG: AmmeMemoRadiSam system radical SAM enzyme [Gemmatimonadales bacterium]|nr:MAG: AmmeMemoRadiSam system radical SAM enzyme [Gemmatimonadales bacterium]